MAKPVMIDTYKESVTCSNCGHEETIEIPKGVTVDGYLSLHECAHCGCNTMGKDFSKPKWQHEHYMGVDPKDLKLCTAMESGKKVHKLLATKH